MVLGRSNTKAVFCFIWVFSLTLLLLLHVVVVVAVAGCLHVIRPTSARESLDMGLYLVHDTTPNTVHDSAFTWAGRHTQIVEITLGFDFREARAATYRMHCPGMRASALLCADCSPLHPRDCVFFFCVRTGDARRRQPSGRDRRSLAKTEARGARLVAVADPAEALWWQRVAIWWWAWA